MAFKSLHVYWIYILTNKKHDVLYIGVTGGIEDRLRRHRSGEGSVFTKKYNAY
ncbi:MAG: GIY-YIG nuclease family protein, partial [Nonlabens sp.]